jgi:hypothetical protein
MLIRDPLGLDKRDIKIFEIFIEGGIGPTGESYSINEVTSIRKFYHIENPEFKILLLRGKFQQIFQSDVPVVVEDIFEKFDQME